MPPSSAAVPDDTADEKSQRDAAAKLSGPQAHRAPRPAREQAREHLAQASTLVRQGDLERAISLFSKSIFLSSSSDALIKRGDAYLLSGDFRSALVNYRAGFSVAKPPSFLLRKVACVCDVYGQICLEARDFPGALSHFSEAVELDRTAALYCAHLALARAAVGDYARAIYALDQAIAIDAIFVDGYVMRGRLYSKLGRSEEAMRDIDMALRIVPNHEGALAYRRMMAVKAQTCTSLATGHLLSGENDAALSEINVALSLTPGDPMLLVKRAVVHRQMGEFDLSAQDLMDAVEAAGGVLPAAQHQFSLTLNEIAVGLIERGEFEEALLHLNKAVAGNPSIAELYMNRGDAFRLLGKLELARANYNKALELKPSSSETKVKLSLIHAEQGRVLFNQAMYEQARYEFSLAIENHPVSSYHELRAEALIMCEDHAGALRDLVTAITLNGGNHSAVDKLVAMCPHGMPKEAREALRKAKAGAGEGGHAHNHRPHLVTSHEEEMESSLEKRRNFVILKRQADEQVRELFSHRPDFTRRKKTGTAVTDAKSAFLKEK